MEKGNYIIEENHHLLSALKDRIPFIPCCVIAHWLPPLAPIKTLKLMLPIFQVQGLEHLGLTVFI